MPLRSPEASVASSYSPATPLPPLPRSVAFAMSVLLVDPCRPSHGGRPRSGKNRHGIAGRADGLQALAVRRWLHERTACTAAGGPARLRRFRARREAATGDAPGGLQRRPGGRRLLRQREAGRRPGTLGRAPAADAWRHGGGSSLLVHLRVAQRTDGRRTVGRARPV